MTERNTAQDALRWQAISKHWKTCNFKFDRKTQALTGMSITINFTKAGNGAAGLEKEIDGLVGLAPVSAELAASQEEVARLRGALEALDAIGEPVQAVVLPEPQAEIEVRSMKTYIDLSIHEWRDKLPDGKYKVYTEPQVRALLAAAGGQAQSKFPYEAPKAAWPWLTNGYAYDENIPEYALQTLTDRAQKNWDALCAAIGAQQVRANALTPAARKALK